jgi:hypothetical protein
LFHLKKHLPFNGSQGRETRELGGVRIMIKPWERGDDRDNKGVGRTHNQKGKIVRSVNEFVVGVSVRIGFGFVRTDQKSGGNVSSMGD